MIDFIVYAIIPVGLALGQASPAVLFSLIFLLCTYYFNGASWMYLAALFQKRSHKQGARLTSIVMPTGLIGGTETILFYSAFILFPQALVWLFTLLGFLDCFNDWAAADLGNSPPGLTLGWRFPAIRWCQPPNFIGVILMFKLLLGQSAPDEIVHTLDGTAVRLSSIWGSGRAALFIFLRHLA